MERDVMGDNTYGPKEMYSSEPISVMHFAFRSHFQKFTSDLNRIMVKYVNDYPYNSLTSFIRFYEEFKKQDLDLITFHENFHKPTVQEDSQNCLGKALCLRRNILKHATNEYPNIDDYLYIGSCNPYLSDDIPNKYHDVLPDNTDVLKDHSCLVIKFTLESERREGFLLFEPGFFIDFPVVIMKDGEAPNSGRFHIISKTGRRSYIFKYFNENYVYWLTEKYDLTKSQDRLAEHRWFFVGKKLQNLIQIEKRNRLNTYHALAFGVLGGAVVSLFIILGSRDYVELAVQDGDPSTNMTQEPKIIAYKIPFTYFLPEGGPRVPEWERALKLFDEKLRKFDNIYELMGRLAVLGTDVNFVKEVTRINDSLRHKIETSFNIK